MKDEQINDIINLLNDESYAEKIFLRPISKYVDFAKVWVKKEEIIGDYPSYDFFFIKDLSSQYVGAVLDMNHDLHWYMKESCRKKGYLTKSLLESILPYIFTNFRDVQTMSIDKAIGDHNYANSKKVAISVGFISVNEEETEFSLNNEDFNWQYENYNEVNISLDPERIKILSQRSCSASNLIRKISDELMMAYGDDEGLSEVAEKIRYFQLKIEDLDWELKNET